MRSPFAKLRWVAGLSVLVATGWLFQVPVSAVQVQNPPDNIQGTAAPFGPPNDPNDPAVRQREEKLALARNAQRQTELVRDTNKLLALAKDLKDEVDKSSKNTLSVDVVKKAAEIEKLAKSVKDRMRQ